MTVSAQVPYNSYTYAGSSVFVFQFQIILATDLQVSVGGSVQPASNYTVSGVGAQNGGSITYTGTLVTGQLVELQRITMLQRSTDYQTEGDFLAATLNADFDRLWMAEQEQQRALGNAIRVPEAAGLPVLPAAAARANTFLGFDLNGTLVLLAGAVGSAASLALQYAGAAGSSLIGFIQAGIGMLSRTVQDELRDNLKLEQSGAVPGTAVDSTTRVQAAFDAGILAFKAIDLVGVYSVGPVSLNGTGHATPANNQYAGLPGLYGRGRFAQSGFIARAGLYGASQYVLTGNNLSGVTYRDLGVDGNGITPNGIDLSWIGGAGGNASAAPSNQNVIQNIFVQGCSGLGGGAALNLSNVHDSKISGIWVRGSDPAGIALRMDAGDGGTMTASDVWVASGLTVLSCQEGGFSNFGLFGGVQLAGAGYNHVSFDKGQINPDPATGACINSTAIGNATRGCVLTGVYFDTMTYCLRGRWHEGATFIGCGFQGWTAFADTANFAAAGGAGNIPVFYFRHCSFEGPVPVSVTGLYRVVLEACLDSSGNVVSTNGATAYSPSWLSTGTAPSLGNGTLVGEYARNGAEVTVEVTLTIGSTTTLGTGSYAFTVPFAVQGTAPRGVGGITHGVTIAIIFPIASSSNTVGAVTTAGAQVSGTVPVSLAAGDSLSFSITYITAAA